MTSAEPGGGTPFEKLRRCDCVPLNFLFYEVIKPCKHLIKRKKKPRNPFTRFVNIYAVQLFSNMLIINVLYPLRALTEI